MQRAESMVIATREPITISFDLTLKPFIDGGWYWFDLEAGDRELVLEEGSWAVETDKQRVGRMSIGITTYNRPDFCTDQLVQLAQNPEVLAVIDEIYVIDQGTQKVTEHEQYAGAAEALGRKLRVIEQGNLGGSGGFSRAMDEATTKGDADYILLLDDDVVCEPEGILRALTFADLARSPMLVGGHMFSLYDRSVLHTYGERVARWRWFWGPAPSTEHAHNFARKPLRTTKWLHRRVDVDYNGWWMCLIPTRVIREVGLALPLFIKWDDAEFGLRAGAAGFPTVSLPGAAVWHVPWHEKDDTIDWQAYFHRRNRIVAALLHSPYEHGGKLVRESLETQVRHLLCMQYAPGRDGPPGHRGHPRRSAADAPRRAEPPPRGQRDAQGVRRLPAQDRSRGLPGSRAQQATAMGQGAAGSDQQGRVRQVVPVERGPSGPAGTRPVEAASGGQRRRPRPQVVAARPVRLGRGVVGRRHERSLVQARPRPGSRHRQTVGGRPCTARQGVAGPREAVPRRCAGPGLAQGVGRDLRRVDQAEVLSR